MGFLFQSTPPHGRRLGPVPTGVIRFWVSIHASAREATADPPRRSALQPGFNPRLRTGGDTQKSKRAPASCVFQSTPPHGRRHRRRLWTHRLLLVSIHASAREATSSPMQVSRNWSFQSTPPHGRRRGGANTIRSLRLFQSTPPHGRRHFSQTFLKC